MKNYSTLSTILETAFKDKLFIELRYRGDYDLQDYNYNLTIRDKKNLYSKKKYLYFDLRMDEELNIIAVRWIINYKDQDHSFIDIDVNDIKNISYDYFN
jgi:hypothetical protein